jgi:hypothetical protein
MTQPTQKVVASVKIVEEEAENKKEFIVVGEWAT